MINALATWYTRRCPDDGVTGIHATPPPTWSSTTLSRRLLNEIGMAK